MDLNQEQAKTLINKISNIEDTISEFWELYNRSLVKTDKQMEMDGNSNKDIALMASKIKIIEKNTTQQTTQQETHLKFLEQLITNQKKEVTDTKEIKDIFKTSFASLNMNIKALRQSFDSDREEGGLLKEQPDSKMEGVLGKLGDKMSELLKESGGPKNIVIEKNEEEDDGILGTLLKWGIGIAGIGFIWGLIKDNPEVQKFLQEAGKMFDNVWNEYIKPHVDWAWNTMVKGLEDLGKGAWEFIKEHWEVFAGAVGIGAAGLGLQIAGLGVLFGQFGIAAAGAVGAIMAATVAAGYILYDLNKAGKKAQQDTEKAWGTNDAVSEKVKKNLSEGNLSEDEKQLRIKKQNLTQQLSNIDISQISMQKELEAWAFGGGSILGIGGNKDQIQKDYNDLNKLKIKLIEEQKKVDEELQKQKDGKTKIDKIREENIPIVPPKNINDPANIDRTPGKSTYLPGELPSSADVYKPISTNNLKPNQGTITKENTVVMNKEQPKDNTVMIDHLANIRVSLDELNARMDQNTEVNLQGHIANAQATIGSVPPAPIINIPKQKLSPNSTRHLANIYTDPDYSFA